MLELRRKLNFHRIAWHYKYIQHVHTKHINLTAFATLKRTDSRVHLWCSYRKNEEKGWKTMCSMHANQRLATAYQKAIINTIRVFIDHLGRSLWLCLCSYVSLFYTSIFYGIWKKYSSTLQLMVVSRASMCTRLVYSL